MSTKKPLKTRLLGGSIGGESFRAFAVFSVILVAAAGISGQLIFKELGLKELERRVSLGEDEARRIADAVTALGRDQGGINFRLLDDKTAVLREIILERLDRHPYLLDVEIRDRFGGPLLYVSRDSLGPPEPTSHPEAIADPRLVSVPLIRGTRSEGEVRVGVSGRAELEKLRSELRIKLIAATSVVLALLGFGLFYVLRLIKKNRELEQRRLAAERRSYVGLLASGLAHEIRNPLNAMNINLQMLEEELPPDVPGFDASEYLELLASTKSEIRRLESLANNFLQYARPGSLSFEPKDLNEVLQSVVMFLQADFRQRNVRLATDLEPLLPSVEMDERQFKQAVINLLVNARQILEKAGRDNREVRLISRAGASGEVVIEVRDNGPGVPEEARDKIFEVFYSSRGGGTGLGLPIARQIVERHGGTIELETVEGEGTSFRIRLPRRHLPGAPSPSAAEPEKASS